MKNFFAVRFTLFKQGIFPCIAFLLTCLPVVAQPSMHYNAATIHEAIKKLNVLGSVLYVAAHPDDENTRLITYFTKEKLYRTAYLSLTRGDGGQNLIGPELYELLGVIRTQELLQARRIDGGNQFFSRARDFGFSKNPDETFEIWDREKVLSDMVWVIRKFRPDVMVTRFNTEPGRTHGHHTASAILASEAFEAAADPKRFPEQLQYVEVWQPKRLLWNTSSWFYTNPADFKTDSMIGIDVGDYNAELGKSYTEIAAQSRSMHKSQGFGSAGARGSSMEYLEHTKGPRAKSDLFEGINTTWGRTEGGAAVEKAVQQLYQNFNPGNPAASVDGLLEVRKLISNLPDSYWKKVKLEETDNLIQACMGLWTEAVAADFSAVPGQKIKVTSEVVNRSAVPAVLKKITWQPGISDTTLSLELKNNTDILLTTQLALPASLPVSQPYWLKEEGTVGMFKVTDQKEIGLPENPPAVQATYTVEIKGQTITFTTPVVFKRTDPVKGEVYQPFIITPPVFIQANEDVLMFADNKPKIISVTVKAGTEKAEGKIVATLPSGWKAEPSSVDYSLTGKGAQKTFRMTIYPSATPSEEKMRLNAVAAGQTYDRGLISIHYDHIPAQHLFPETVIKINRLDLKKKGTNIAYIMGAGDEIPQALEQIGYQVTILNDKPVNAEVLSRFDAVITGIRAFNTTEKLKTIHPLLLDYVRNGGTLVCQYNTMPNRITADAYVTDSIGPYPFKISRDRVTKEDAPVTLLDPRHPLLNTPNKIGPKDFEGWIQERGLYFPNEWSKEYQTIISMHDPGETPKDGSILYARYGKGVFIYTSLSWFRQLPTGVTGAYRIFANLISARK